MKVIGRVEIEVQGKRIELSVEEARKLLKLLEGVFGEQKMIPYPLPYPAPTYPQWPNYPLITNKDTSLPC